MAVDVNQPKEKQFYSTDNNLQTPVELLAISLYLNCLEDVTDLRKVLQRVAWKTCNYHKISLGLISFLISFCVYKYSKLVNMTHSSKVFFDCTIIFSFLLRIGISKLCTYIRVLCMSVSLL